MPIPGYKVIPDGWAAHHRPTANSTMTYICDLYVPAAGPPPYPEPQGWDGTSLLKADVPCRVQELNRPGSATVVEQPTRTRDYLVTLPLAGLPDLPVGERGTIVRNFRPKNPIDADPGLARRTLRAIDVQHGSLMWERDLICTENMTQNNPKP